MADLMTERLTLAYQERIVIDSLDLEIPTGKVTALVGRNGCGKSTLLRSMARLLAPKSGTVLLDGESISRLPTKALAQRLGILPQGPTAPEGLTVRELVAQGRYPHQGWLRQWSEEDERQVEKALKSTGMLELADRSLDALSGGQRQRAWIAMTLAQGTEVLLLDEPTTYLDMVHQVEILELLALLNLTEGRTIVMVLHDLNMACRYAHHVVALKEGRVFAAGAPEVVMTETLVKEVFGMNCCIVEDPVTGTPMCVPGCDKQLCRRLPLSCD